MTEEKEKHEFTKFQIVMEALDRELSHYRKRAGQIYFIGFFLEVLILGGKEKINLGNIGENMTAGIYSFLFIIIAFVVVLYGREYLRRINILKNERNKLLDQLSHKVEFPSSKNHQINELNTMSIVLVLLSLVGVSIFWINAKYSPNDSFKNDCTCIESILKTTNDEIK